MGPCPQKLWDAGNGGAPFLPQGARGERSAACSQEKTLREKCSAEMEGLGFLQPGLGDAGLELRLGTRYFCMLLRKLPASLYTYESLDPRSGGWPRTPVPHHDVLRMG